MGKGLAKVFGDMTLSDFHDLLLPQEQSPLVQRRRAALIVSRVRMVAALFALLTPLWIPIDLLVFEAELSIPLAVLRVLAACAFGALAFSFKRTDSIATARWALVFLLSVPTGFFLLSSPMLARFLVANGPQQMIASGYAFLPFVMVAGLSVFPITALEGALYALPIWASNAAVAFFGYQLMPFASQLGALWLLALLAVVATLAGMSQLQFMVQLVTQASHDGLTRAYTRRVGEELLELQFTQARRSGSCLALVFLDLDDFKSVNDLYGHEEGDSTLRAAAGALRKCLRRGDILIRWGGEEFLVVMPNTDCCGAYIGIERLREGGFGGRPDRSRQTASIGISEWLKDGCKSWPDLVEKADQRMYMAKQGGKDRIVTCGEIGDCGDGPGEQRVDMAESLAAAD